MSFVVNVSRNTVEDGQQQSEADEVGASASPDPDRVLFTVLPVNRFGISRCVQNYFLRSKYNHVWCFFFCCCE
jgi:hypothetical protein